MHTPHRFFFTMILLTALSIAFPARSAPVQEKAADILKFAQMDFQSKKFDSAKMAYDRVISAPDADAGMKATAHIGIANILLQGEKPQPTPAREECEKALALPGLPTNWRLTLLFLTAVTYERMSPANWDEAIFLYEKIADEPGGDNRSKINALNKISQAYIAKEDAEKAAEAINRALALPDIKPAEILTALTNQGALLLNQHKYQEARDTYQKMIDLDQSDRNQANVRKLIIATWTAEGNLNKFIELAEKELSLPELPVQDRISLMFMSASTYERMSPPGRDKAFSLYEKIANEPGGDNRSKLNALNKIGQFYAAKGEAQKATETLNRALALPDLKPEELLTALSNQGALLLNQGKYQAARDTYQKMIDLDRSNRNTANVRKMIIATWTAEGNLDKAIEVGLQGHDGLEIADLYQKKGDAKAALIQLLSILNDQKADYQLKSTAFNRLMTVYAATDDYAQARKDVETFLPQLSDSDPNQPAALLPLIKSAMESGNYESASWAATVTIKASKLPDRDYMLVRLWLVNSLGALGRLDEACKVAETAADDEKLAVANRFRFRLTADALASTGRTDEIKNAYTRSLALFVGYTPTVKERAEVLLNVAKSALMAGKDHTAGELYNLHQALFLKEPQVSYICDFMDEAPSDVGAWLASSLLQDPKKEAKVNRKYGENLAFLLGTDAATTDRGVTAEGKGSDDTRTDLHMACDVNGIHFFFKTVDSKADEIKSQLVSGGSYEGYLAPGTNRPYYCFLIDLPSGLLNASFPSMYPNRNFQQAQVHNNTIISSTLPTKDGFATHLFYSWELFYDNLPANGDKWQFETLRWTRSGGFSWAGSESVHNRSSWGDIVFNNLTEKNLLAIKRNLIFKALVNYEKEKSPKTKGSIDFWKDAELGDLQFYSAALAPLVARLDAFSKKTTKTMSYIDIDILFEQAIPNWMEFKYRAEELRYKYLMDKYFIQN